MGCNSSRLVQDSTSAKLQKNQNKSKIKAGESENGEISGKSSHLQDEKKKRAQVKITKGKSRKKDGSWGKDESEDEGESGDEDESGDESESEDEGENEAVCPECLQRKHRNSRRVEKNHKSLKKPKKKRKSSSKKGSKRGKGAEKHSTGSIVQYNQLENDKNKEVANPRRNKILQGPLGSESSFDSLVDSSENSEQEDCECDPIKPINDYNYRGEKQENSWGRRNEETNQKKYTFTKLNKS